MFNIRKDATCTGSFFFRNFNPKGTQFAADNLVVCQYEVIFELSNIESIPAAIRISIVDVATRYYRQDGVLERADGATAPSLWQPSSSATASISIGACLLLGGGTASRLRFSHPGLTPLLYTNVYIKIRVLVLPPPDSRRTCNGPAFSGEGVIITNRLKFNPTNYSCVPIFLKILFKRN